MNEPITLYETSLEALRDRVDTRLQDYCGHHSDCPVGLREAMQYSLLAGGKRLRPILVLLSCEASGGDSDAALSAACAIEFVHTYSLIHDDLPAMDDDDLRRGRPTCHVMFGEANAILAGDALLTYAFEILATETHPAATAAECCAELARAAGPCGMVGGQFADLEAEDSIAVGSEGQATRLERLESIHDRKTGRLITAAVSLGARVAGADDETWRSLCRYGERVGLAFQIADDLLDRASNEARMGKRTQKDAQRGKLTCPDVIGESAGRERAHQLVDDACRQIAHLGARAVQLESLAHFVIQRDH